MKPGREALFPGNKTRLTSTRCQLDTYDTWDIHPTPITGNGRKTAEKGPLSALEKGISATNDYLGTSRFAKK
jgi:hypothetical protein